MNGGGGIGGTKQGGRWGGGWGGQRRGRSLHAVSVFVIIELLSADGEEGSRFFDREDRNTSTTTTAMIQIMKMMMADITAPAIAPEAMEPWSEVSTAAVGEEGREEEDKWGREEQVKGVVGTAKANLNL